jgi:hypothetical protein
MDFRLTYEGRLFANNEENELKRAPHKHVIRKIFHKQLKKLWYHHPVLKERTELRHYTGGGKTMLEVEADKFKEHGYSFVPLVTKENHLICQVEILMLRPGEPGSVISAGDIDNRIKTLFDALRKPNSLGELAGASPAPDEIPFFCLLEDDSLITHASIETDTLLEPVNDQASDQASDVRIVITVNVRPYGGPAASQDFLWSVKR